MGQIFSTTTRILSKELLSNKDFGKESLQAGNCDNASFGKMIIKM